MRRKQRYLTYGGLIGFGVVALIDILRQWNDHVSKNKPFTWDSYNGLQTLKNGFIGGIIGSGIGYLAYEYRLSEESKLPFSSDEHLKKVISQERLRADPTALQRVLNYRERVKRSLESKFGARLAGPPEDSGSFYKRTAIASNFDLDVVLPFKRKSYSTLEEMYYDVHEVVGKEFDHEAIVTKNTKAIGLTFEEEEGPIHFDIVPGREINNYAIEKDLNLYVRPDWFWQRGSSFKTNIKAQNKIIKNRPEARAIVKLLKLYRDKNGFSLPGVLVEQCVVEAMSNKRYGTHPSTTENLLNCMGYVAKKISQKKVIDHVNSNNNLNNRTDDYSKGAFADQLITDVERIEDDPRYIKEIFEI